MPGSCGASCIFLVAVFVDNRTRDENKKTRKETRKKGIESSHNELESEQVLVAKKKKVREDTPRLHLKGYPPRA